MSDLSRVAVNRALAALRVASEGDESDTRAKAFIAGAHALLVHGENAGVILRESPDHTLRKAATAANLYGDPEWGSGNAGDLARSYLASIAQEDGVAALARSARVIPDKLQHVVIATGHTTGTVAEGAPKAVVHQTLTGDDAELRKSASIVVFSEELSRATGGEAETLFERELRSGVVRGSNSALAAIMAGAPSTPVTATGDALADLRAGLAAAQPASGYVVLAPHAAVADLATRAENAGGMGIRGGTFRPGIDVVAIDGASATLIVPASGIALHDHGIVMRRAAHASVQMDSDPDDPGTAATTLVSLWQRNLVGLLVERSFRIAIGATRVVKVAA